MLTFVNHLCPSRLITKLLFSVVVWPSGMPLQMLDFVSHQEKIFGLQKVNICQHAWTRIAPAEWQVLTGSESPRNPFPGKRSEWIFAGAPEP